ncbi:lipopolysaccharide heptosyltransferase I [Geobacter argillaceus]|uniref:Lipopolysaccharide heptosyltransferase 1 n=1 Tax=Geobacter argillaceus TaxID=345631 RepID=A0A562VN10_9BACT|nr:lipopolysaccharide heptosyltransferase I [Geobacter argillaceus]TWJ19285.1 heptosyltransferase-1 [Geobacter argillaceus]
MRVLIVKTSALGDIIHALPVLDYLHQVVPGIEVDWVVEEPFRDLLAGNPLVSQLHTVRTKVWRRSPFATATRRDIAALKESLRERRYDIVFDIQGNLKSGLIDWLSGGEEVLGFTGDDLQERINLLFTTRHIPLRSQDRHVTDKYLRVVSTPFGRDFRQYELRTDIHTSPEDEQAAEALMATLGEGLVFLFHTGTTWQTKFWHQEGWIDLGRQLLAGYPESTVLLSWGNEAERQTVTGLATSIGPGARVTDRYSLKGLAALLKKVDLVVGGDTGPVHLAAAVGTPTVSLYRSSDGNGSGPRGNSHVVIQSPISCTRCFRTKCERDEECRRSITVEMVMNGVRKLIG